MCRPIPYHARVKHFYVTLTLTLPFCFYQMGHAVAEAAVKRGLTLIPYSFTGSGDQGNIVSCEGVRVELKEPEEWVETLEEVRKTYPNFIVVDYTLPAAVNGEFDKTWMTCVPVRV